MATRFLHPFDPAGDYVAERKIELDYNLTLEGGDAVPLDKISTRLARMLYEQRRISYRVQPAPLPGWGALKATVPAGSTRTDKLPDPARAPATPAPVAAKPKAKPKKKGAKAPTPPSPVAPAVA